MNHGRQIWSHDIYIDGLNHHFKHEFVPGRNEIKYVTARRE